MPYSDDKNWWSHICIYFLSNTHRDSEVFSSADSHLTNEKKVFKKLLTTDFPLWSSSLTLSSTHVVFSPLPLPLPNRMWFYLWCCFLFVCSSRFMTTPLFFYCWFWCISLHFHVCWVKKPLHKVTFLSSYKWTSNHNNPSTSITLLTWSCHTSYKGRRRSSALSLYSVTTGFFVC